MKFHSKSITIPKEELGDVLIYGFESVGNHIIPPHYQPKRFSGDTLLWLLPAKEPTDQKAVCVRGGAYEVKTGARGASVKFIGGYTKKEYPAARPACDFLGRAWQMDIPEGDTLLYACARFYWDHQLCQIAERTYLRKKTDIREGYVLSTLNKKAYAGTYPAVDHEFHWKGRFAVGGAAEASLIRRMLELQLKVMREDRTGLSKNLCAVQPNGSREYNVWRKSRDGREKAQMFRVTANIEFIEGMHLYYRMTKDLDFLRVNINAIEASCAYIERFIGKHDLLESHVYYEDQVIKDGCAAQAQCFAVNGFRLMSELERLLGRGEEARRYINLADRLGQAVVREFPKGCWSGKDGRFIDWIDSKGRTHDHIHLLANELPVLFGLAEPGQEGRCAETLRRHEEVLQKFPSFVAAKIEDYTQSEIGSGGPYDLCAAGRYWCWDAAYLAHLRDGAALRRQLDQVAKQARADGWQMGERYDMNYIYYIDEQNWHGASLYYEYPNVFWHVLVNDYLGLSYGFDCDLVVRPLFGEGTVKLDAYGVEFSIRDSRFAIRNLSGRPLTVELPLLEKRIQLEPGEQFESPAE